MADRKSETPAPEAAQPRPAETSAPASGERPDWVIPPHWGPNLMLYSDISRMMFRLHRNLEAHMDAHKRLADRLQTVLAHEQDMVLELARLIDQSVNQAARDSNAKTPTVGNAALDRIFDHAASAMKETGRMLTDIQLETLDLLRQYIDDTAKAGADADAKKGKKQK